MAAIKAGLGSPESWEVGLVQGKLALLAAVDDVVAKLRKAIDSLDMEWLSYALEQARRLDMAHDSREEVRIVTEHARTTLVKLKECIRLLREARGSSRIEQLAGALTATDEVGYKAGLVDEVRARHEVFAALLKEAGLTLQVGTREDLKELVSRCVAAGLESPVIEEMGKRCDDP